MNNYKSKVMTVLKSTKLLHVHEHTIYINSFKCMHVYCVHRVVKRQDIVKETLMFALWSPESEIFEKWNQIDTLDVAKFKFNIFFVDKCFVKETNLFLNVQIKCNLTSVLDLVSLQWVYHVYCAIDCHTAIHLIMN